MGQQQLLLVILVTIIVGIATVVAINVFGSSAANANQDAVRQDVITIAASAQGWYIKPSMMGGGNNSFAGMTFRDIQFAADEIDASDNLTAYNMNGTYVLAEDGNDTSIQITAHPSSCDGYTDNDRTCSTTDQFVADIYRSNLVWTSAAGTTPPPSE